MESIKTYRDQMQKIAAHASGRDKNAPTQFQSQMYAGDFLALIMALPIDADNWQPLQDATTGELFFVLGGDLLGGDVPLGG